MRTSSWRPASRFISACATICNMSISRRLRNSAHRCMLSEPYTRSSSSYDGETLHAWSDEICRAKASRYIRAGASEGFSQRAAMNIVRTCCMHGHHAGSQFSEFRCGNPRTGNCLDSICPARLSSIALYIGNASCSRAAPEFHFFSPSCVRNAPGPSASVSAYPD